MAAARMKVLATRRYPGPAFAELGEVAIAPLEAIAGARSGIGALIVANEPVPLEFFPDLRLVANFGVGYDRIDVAACAARGVAVTNTPGVLDAATADLAFALILATRRRVVEGDRTVREGRWTWAWSAGFLAQELSGSTLGIVGFGRIGQAVARRARGFDLQILFNRRTQEASDLGRWCPLDELLARSDIVSIHLPLTSQTRGLLDGVKLTLIRDGGCLINTARGEILDEGALTRELVAGRISAGLDVFAREPSVPVELLGLPNVVLTPHLGSATVQTRAAMTRLVVDNIRALERGEPLLTPVST